MAKYFLFGYVMASGVIFNILFLLALTGYQTTITTPLWWIDFLRSVGFVVEMIR